MFQFVIMQPPWTGWAEHLQNCDTNIQQQIHKCKRIAIIKMFQFVRMQPPWTGWAEYLRDRDRNVQFPPTSVWASTAFIMSATTKKPKKKVEKKGFFNGYFG